jgi:hypothetical protein
MRLANGNICSLFYFEGLGLPGRLLNSGSMPPRVRKPLPRNDQWKAPTPDLEGHRKSLREALGNTLSDEFVDVILGKLVEALRPGLYDQLEEATLNAALATIDSMQPRSELQAVLAMALSKKSQAGRTSRNDLHRHMTEDFIPRRLALRVGATGSYRS